MTVSIPTKWRSVLPHLDAPLPPDRTPARVTADNAVSVNLPMALVRQCTRNDEYWEIPLPVLDAYRSYRPTPLWRATRFETAVGAKVPIWVKYEGGNISGSHKLTTALAQAYYYRNAGARELVTGTGAGQWGTALAAACALFGLRCTVFMVGSSLSRKPYRGVLMKMLGAEVQASPSGTTRVSRSAQGQGNSLSLAIGEAVEYAAGRDGAAFCIGSGETYSILHQSVIGIEAGEQLQEQGGEVDAVVGCVGAGSNFGGVALPFHAEARSQGTNAPLLVAAESSSAPKLTQGIYAYDRTDSTDTSPLEAMYTIGSSYSIPDSHSAGLRFHGAAKLVSALRHSGHVAAMAIDQVVALEAGQRFATAEMVVPAPESGHALAAAAQLATTGADDLQASHGVLVCVSGHGYLDLSAYQQLLDGELNDQSPDAQALLAAVSGLAPVSTTAAVAQ